MRSWPLRTSRSPKWLKSGTNQSTWPAAFAANTGYKPIDFLADRFEIKMPALADVA